MGRFGAKKQPAALAKLKGYYRPSRYKDELSPAGLLFLDEVPDPPEALNSDGVRLWEGVIKGAIAIEGYFAVHDLFLFEQLCQTYQMLCEAQRNLKNYGMYRVNEKKEVRASAFSKNYLEIVKTYLVLCREFGLSPSSRDSIKLMSKSENKDPYQGLVL